MKTVREKVKMYVCLACCYKDSTKEVSCFLSLLSHTFENIIIIIIIIIASMLREICPGQPAAAAEAATVGGPRALAGAHARDWHAAEPAFPPCLQTCHAVRRCAHRGLALGHHRRCRRPGMSSMRLLTPPPAAPQLNSAGMHRCMAARSLQARIPARAPRGGGYGGAARAARSGTVECIFRCPTRRWR
mgnify:CR=1 FL=1